MGSFFFLFFTPLGLKLSDTQVYEPEKRALLGTASHFCEALALQLRIVPNGTNPFAALCVN